jgi:DNA-binding ferritin-like protein
VEERVVQVDKVSEDVRQVGRRPIQTMRKAMWVRMFLVEEVARLYISYGNVLMGGEWWYQLMSR